MSALPIILATFCCFVVAYRYYHGFISAKVAVLDDARVTPAHTQFDRQNYFPMRRWILFGHHFAAITGAGPLIGPVLAAQFGFLPGWLWIIFGVTLGGAVHDFIILISSVRRGGKSLAEIARIELGPLAGSIASIAILFIVLVSIAVMGLVVVNALERSPWGTFAVFMSIPIGLLMGMNMFKWNPGKTSITTTTGVIVLLSCVLLGKYVPYSFLANLFSLSHQQLSLSIAVYGFIASVLPVWMLLAPRDYLSSFLKLGTIAILAIAVMIVHPNLKMGWVTPFIHGGGPIIPGKLYPFCFITIACGAISGFHSLISSGTTSKMLDKESDARPIAFGAMLCEGFIAIISLIAACSLYPADYFAINSMPAKFAALHLQPVRLDVLSSQVQETLMGRTGGGVSLAVGMAQIFGRLPFMNHLVGYWYHFTILFEALFVLTVVDAGTRVARFLLQESLGKIYSPFEKTDWWLGSIITSAFVVLFWGYLLYTGTISTLWPLFGIANQLLASIALMVATVVLINEGKKKYAWVTFAPFVFLGVTTTWAGIANIYISLIPMVASGKVFQGYMNIGLDLFMIVCVLIIFGCALQRVIPTLGSVKK